MIIHIGIAHYPGVMESAVAGLKELFLLANRICSEYELEQRFECEVVFFKEDNHASPTLPDVQIVIIPPCLEGEYHKHPSSDLLSWLSSRHRQGSLICSVCAGVFILARTGLLEGRPATTHWHLADDFSQHYPEVCLESHKILINDGDIISAGGLMAWLDLGLELVAQFTHPKVMRQLGKSLVVDTGQREQRYYRTFVPKLNHGNAAILKVQHHLQKHFQQSISVPQMAEICILTERTFLRQFVNATGIKPNQYLQQLRIQKACEFLESTQETVERVALRVGYEDISAFRKVFIKITGLTPRDFRMRFGNRKFE